MDNHSAIRGTFSSSLRSNPIWEVIGPILMASSKSIEEVSRPQVDFTFIQEGDNEHLQLLLLTPSSLEAYQKRSLILRLREFAASDSSSCPRKAIAFLLSEDAFSNASEKYSLNGLLALQVLLFESLAVPLPVIAIPDAASFLASVKEYMANLEDIPVTSSALGESLALLAQATSEYPNALCEQATNILSDLFPSFKSLSEATRTLEGQEVLREYLGGEAAAKIVRFWQEDLLTE
ncbi:hypothetical protein BJY00DRAFT_312242 [Aspergillus carlsbadensis]|nr:hypothetical protein BJY00DRAFT_312242 [Aspergillus carlsbadensis]